MEEKFSASVFGFNCNIWRVNLSEVPLDFNPLFLIVRKTCCTLSLLLFFLELVHNNRNKQIHDEERCYENEYHENNLDCWLIVDYTS